MLRQLSYDHAAPMSVERYGVPVLTKKHPKRVHKRPYRPSRGLMR